MALRYALQVSVTSLHADQFCRVRTTITGTHLAGRAQALAVIPPKLHQHRTSRRASMDLPVCNMELCSNKHSKQA